MIYETRFLSTYARRQAGLRQILTGESGGYDIDFLR